ncbi:hypothetical protein [Streptomyces sp. NPDC056660]|uniref:hypothetical protein n=1 Tax=Streptomyces sp. NPDC056660 TaxID=3345897 RepID=UPI00367B4EF4
MRRLHALWALAGAAGLLAGAITPATAAPGSPVTTPVTPLTGPSTTIAQTATPPATVTLITGDTVTLTVGPDGKNAVDVRRGKGREAATFLSSEKDGEIGVLPADAIPLIKAGRLDPALFNVSQLVEQGYTDAKTGSTPVIATYGRGAKTPEGALRTLALPGIDGASLKIPQDRPLPRAPGPRWGSPPSTRWCTGRFCISPTPARPAGRC